MRWFLRDNKFYIGPISDMQIDEFMSKDIFRSCGIACSAGSGKVETYLTVPNEPHVASKLEKLRFVGA